MAAPVLPSSFRDKGEIGPTLDEFCRQLDAVGIGLMRHGEPDELALWHENNGGDSAWREGAEIATERVIGPTATLAHDRAYFAVPVLGNAIFVTAREGKRPFTQEEQQVITNFAYQLGVAADNAQLFESQQEALQVKDQFLSIVSHELRTPLTTIKGYAQILKSKLVDEPDERRFAANIDSQVGRLSRLVDDLLDVTRYSRTQFELKRQPVELRSLLEDVATRFRLVAKDHPIVLNVGSGIFTGHWDRDRLEQVMNNLVGNAVKYSPPEGTVTISSYQTGDRVVVSVRDEGVGIPQQDQEHLFERFYRGTAEGGQVTGLGLGLYVSRRIVEAHGGTIGVKSEEGEGSEFFFSLPLAPAPRPLVTAST